MMLCGDCGYSIVSKPFILAIMKRFTWTDTTDHAPLLSRAQAGDEPAMEALLEQYRPLVSRTVAQYHRPGRHLEEEDLAQIARLALVKAIRRFDSTRGVGFTHFAARCIQADLLHAIESQSYEIAVPRNIQSQVRQMRRVIQEYERDTGESPTVEEIALRFGLDRDEAVFRLNLPWNMISHAEEPEIESLAEAEGEPSDLRVLLSSLMAPLNSRQRYLLHLVYGLEYTYQEISRRLGISRQAVRQQTLRALQHLQDRMGMMMTYSEVR